MARGSNFLGQVVADEIEVRYAFSGKVGAVKKRTGDEVKKGEVLAVLDGRLLQLELDLQLADYERRRAEFEIFVRKNTGGGDEAMFAKKIEQAQLNASVKEVELAKLRMDQATLVSPVNGIVLDDGGNRVGLNVSPASNAFKILDVDAKRFEITTEDHLERGGIVEGVVNSKKIEGKIGVSRPVGQKFVVWVELENWEGLEVGMKGEAWLIRD